MQFDLFDNRDSRKIIKGDVLELKTLPDDGSKDLPLEHLCITLNTGFNILLELSTIKTINRWCDENGVDVS